MMQVEEIIRKYDFHDSCVVGILHEMDSIKMKIDLCMWRQQGYRDNEKELKEVTLKFYAVQDYKWDSDKKEEDIDYDTILEIGYNEKIIKIILVDDSVSIITFKCNEVELIE